MVLAFVGDSTITSVLGIGLGVERSSGPNVNTDDASPRLVSVGNVIRYIALEGVDGSGKSTIASAVAARLSDAGEEVVMVREPGGSSVGEVIRELLLDSDELDDRAEALLFAAQRAVLVSEVVRPALRDGKWVISDRTFYSSIAYQGRARGMGEERIRELNEWAVSGVVPDMVFVLDVAPHRALDRQHRADRIGKEGVDFQAEVRDAYYAMADQDPGRVVILDGSMTVDELADRIVEAVGR
jgi:dTMP kinase